MNLTSTRLFQVRPQKKPVTRNAGRSCLLHVSWVILAFTVYACTVEQDERVGAGEGSQLTGSCTDGSMNILLYVSDDHSQDTGAYGNEVIQTPNLDALADEGTLFTHAFATTASCSASRSVILSGLHNHRTGQYGHEHDYHEFTSFDHIQSVSNLLSENGYRTARSGKYHVAPERVYRFDEVLPGSARNPIELALEAEDFISAGGDPFFLLMATSDPHRGGGRAEELPYEPDRFGNVPGGHEGEDPVEYDPDEVIVPSWLPDNEATRQELAQYYQSVSRLDQGFGKMMELLQETGEFENTVVIYISDHGMAFPGAKTTVYEPGLLSPLIVRDPCLDTRGIVNDALISWTDITPTILDYAGVEPPEYSRHVNQAVLRDHLPGTHGLHGRSFRPILEQSSPEGWDTVYASHTFHEVQMYYPMRVVRDREYKLIWNKAHGMPYPFASDLQTSSTWQYISAQGRDAVFGVRTVGEYLHRPEFELYDMQVDPHESDNLADDPAYSDVMQEYIGKLHDFQRNTSDPWYLHWVYRDEAAGFYEDVEEF